jgi:hypothetical protein
MENIEFGTGDDCFQNRAALHAKPCCSGWPKASFTLIIVAMLSLDYVVAITQAFWGVERGCASFPLPCRLCR